MRTLSKSESGDLVEVPSKKGLHLFQRLISQNKQGPNQPVNSKKRRRLEEVLIRKWVDRLNLFLSALVSLVTQFQSSEVMEITRNNDKLLVSISRPSTKLIMRQELLLLKRLPHLRFMKVAQDNLRIHLTDSATLVDLIKFRLSLREYSGDKTQQRIWNLKSIYQSIVQSLKTLSSSNRIMLDPEYLWKLNSLLVMSSMVLHSEDVPVIAIRKSE